MNKKFNSKPFLFNSPLLIKKKMTLLTSNFQTVEYFNKKKENEETHWSLKASIITVNASSGTSPIRLLPYTHTQRRKKVKFDTSFNKFMSCASSHHVLTWNDTRFQREVLCKSTMKMTFLHGTAH